VIYIYPSHRLYLYPPSYTHNNLHKNPTNTHPKNPPEWASIDISYGLFLSDHQILDIAESELVIIPAILCQDLPGPTEWHFKACLRVGLTREEVDAVQRVVERVLMYGGGGVTRVGSVWDVVVEEEG
jgi:hypothetical protein